MVGPEPELIWSGRQHLGDEPGIFGDAGYSGIALEFPITLRKTDPAAVDTTTLILDTGEVQTFTGYPGHDITVTAYTADPADPTHFVETVLAAEKLTTADSNHKELSISLAGMPSPVFVSVRVRVDTQVPPGLYDDFVVTRLSNRAENFAFVASFGFSA